MNVVFPLPLSTIFPNRFLPLRKLRVEQFHRRFRNWCWHSLIAKLAPLTRAPKTPGLSRTKRRCFLLKVVCMAGSTYIMPELMGEILFGSPTLAMPLEIKIKRVFRYLINVLVWLYLEIVFRFQLKLFFKLEWIFSFVVFMFY